MNSLKILFVHSPSILVAKNITFEPKIFFSRGSHRNKFDPDADIQWTTITQGAVDSLMAIDVIANNKQIDSSKIGIMGWSLSLIHI